MSADYLTLQNVCVARGGNRVLHGISLQIRRGEITALLGANGAGKSSLVLAVAGLVPIERGEVLLEGRSVANRRPEAIRRQGIVAVPEGHQVLTALTVRENLQAAGGALTRTALRREIDEVLETFPELVDRLEIPAGNLSGGQQQMVALAQAIIARPSYLLADELSFGLAPIIVARLVPVLVQLAARGVGILLIEQFTALALSVATQAYVMARGRLAFTGAARELSDNPDILHAAYL